MGIPTDVQMDRHIERFGRNPLCPFCRSHLRMDVSEIRAAFEKMRKSFAGRIAS